MAYEAGRCFTDDEVRRGSLGRYKSVEERVVMQAHFDSCPDCALRVEEFHEPDEIDEIFENIATLLTADDRLKENRRR